ncbi:MAG: glycosyltransferase [Paracoccus sp. (in: a-proteobacteria)]|nr:glycosyltransferase [Paracoccus sp. (in: a-proteobacteria)]
MQKADGSPSSRNAQAPREFVIIAQARSGSTFLRKALNAQHDITCHGEVLSHAWIEGLEPRPGEHPLDAETIRAMMPGRDADVTGFLRDHVMVFGQQITGFKIVYGNFFDPSLHEELLGLIRARGMAVIHLRRQNQLAALASTMRMQQFGLNHSHVLAPAEDRPPVEKLHIPIERIEGYIRRQAGLADRVDALFPDAVQASYETLHEDFPRILGHLGIDEPRDFDAGLDKLAPTDLSEAIGNYAELAEYDVAAQPLWQSETGQTAGAVAPAGPRRRESILVILGMHRSGTSFLTHCTEILGFSLPGDRGGPASDNPKGHFEPRAIVDLNDASFARDGAVWARIAPLRSTPAPADMNEALERSFGAAPRIAIKDPRLSLLMPGWRAFLESSGPVGALIALRHPGEVAASVARRDGIGTDLAYLSWAAHTLAALDASEGMRRTLILFPDWTAEIGTTLERIAAVADVDLPADAAAEVAARFEADAVHGGQQISPADPEIDLMARDLFEALARHAREGTLPTPDDLAPFRARFETVAAAASTVEAHLASRLRQLQAEAAQFAADGAALQQQVAQTRAERDKIVHSLQDHVAATEAQRDDLAGQLDATRASVQEQIDHLSRLLEKERMTILKPVYRRLHRAGGRVLRGVLPRRAFDWLKMAMPYPGGAPTYLAYSAGNPPQGEIMALDDIPAADPEKADIFVLSIIGWDFRTQRPQHLATEMARQGHRVFYIEMETDPGPGSARQVAPGVHVLRLPARGMRGVTPYSGDIPAAALRVWIDHFHRLADGLNTTRMAHVVIEHPYWWSFARHLSSQFRLTFDCMDEIAGFANTEPAILALEEEMIDRADRMIVSSQYLYDKYAPRRKLALIRNGTDVSHFIRQQDDPAPVPGWLTGKLREGAIRVGYVGAIAEWFDAALVEQVARDNPDFDIHLCGAVTAEAPARLRDMANITMHGEILYADVPGFLDAMDVLIIPFRLVPIIMACDPVKFYEYSAMRRPTVATALPELERAGDLVITAHDAAGFGQGIRAAAARGSDPAFGDRLREYALENAWSYRAADMLAEMETAPLLSVVVLAYGAADLTLDCLESLVGRGASWPSLEVLVVDNGSPPAELERLRAATAGDARVRLIENGENLGFARGNNVGIEAARGEYVLLLNNDTYVPPGALAAMVRHLERNPGIGIIGPMTNNIGNEARIEVSYDNMAQMERIARDLTTGYRGVTSEIPVCAYFCAMFRRADLDRIGHLPTVYGRGMFEDDDHCAAFHAAGLATALAEDAFVHHHLSATFGQIPSAEKQALFERNKAIFEERWGAWTPHIYRDRRPAPGLPDKG